MITVGIKHKTHTVQNIYVCVEMLTVYVGFTGMETKLTDDGEETHIPMY